MKAYQYTALDANGQEVRGNVNADDRKDASTKLRNQGLYVIELNDGTSGPVMVTASKNNVMMAIREQLPIGSTDKIFYFKQLSLMLRAGMSLTDSLNTLIHLLSNPRMKKIVADILYRVRAGETFSHATAAAEIFPQMAEFMIRSAEASGELDAVLVRIADHMERRAKLQRDIITTAFYPMIVVLLGVGMFFFLVTSVIPEFAKFFRDSGKPIPPISQSLIDLGDFFGQYGVLILVLFVLLILSLMALYRTASGRLAMDTFTLRVPLIGGIVTFGSMSQLTWSLSMLLNSGLTAVEALDITGRLIPNRLISNNVFDARERVIRGQDLASSLVATGITPLVQQLAGVGEKSGNLDRIMEEAGNFYEEALQVKSKLLGAMIEPAAILIIGSMVGFVYYAFLKTIFSVG